MPILVSSNYTKPPQIGKLTSCSIIIIGGGIARLIYPLLQRHYRLTAIWRRKEKTLPYSR